MKPEGVPREGEPVVSVYVGREMSRRRFLSVGGVGLAGAALLGTAGCGGGSERGEGESIAKAFRDDFTGAPDGPLDGRVAPSGQVWNDFNDGLRLDDGRVRRIVPQGAGGGYGQINLDAAVTSMTAKVSWLGKSDTDRENGSLVLIYSHADVHGGNPPTKQIFKDSVHLAIGPWLTSITVYEEGVVVGEAKSVVYPDGRLDVDGTVYSIGLERRGRSISVIRPDGIVSDIADPRFESFAGPYLIWQCYDTVSPNLSSRFESVAATTDPLPD